jgi:hypothetical protein
MKVLHALRLASNTRKLPFLLIGGHAVNIHGYSRNTHDLDILVPRVTLPAWKEALSGLGYSLLGERAAFAAFDTSQKDKPRLDLMLVNDTTFEKLRKGAKNFEYQGTELSVVSVEHLIALKLHVLRQGLPGRFSKDLLDVIELIRANKIDLRSPEMQEILDKYSTEELTHTIRRHCER